MVCKNDFILQILDNCVYARLFGQQNCILPSPTERQFLETAIFEYIKSENIRDVIIVRKRDEDGLLLSELLYSNSVRITHVQMEEVDETAKLKLLESYFSTFGSSKSANITLISLEDREETDWQLINLISSNYVKILVIGGFEKWQERLLEVKPYELDLIVITHHKESVLPLDDYLTKEENFLYGCKSEDVYTVWKSFMSDRGAQRLLRVAVWRNDSGLINMMPEKDTIIIRVAMVDYRPFARFHFINGTLTLSDCILKRLLNEFTEQLNLKFKLLEVPDNKYGRKVDNNWTGAVGMVLRGEADMIPYIPVTNSRRNVLDFSNPTAFVSHGMLVAYPKESTRVFIFFRIFQKEVWILLIASTIILSYILHKTLSFNSDSIKYTSFFQCFWLIYGFLFQQGTTYTPSAHSARILLVTCWLSILVFTTMFSANLTALFASSRTEYIVKTLEELINHETISLTITDDNPVYENIQESQVKLYDRIRKVFPEDGHRLNVLKQPISTEFLNDVAAGKTVYVDTFYSLAAILSHDLRIYNNRCRITIAPDRFVTNELAFGLRKGSSLLQPLNKLIQRMTERGIFSATEEAKRTEWEINMEPCDEHPSQRAVKTVDLLGPFFILFFALLFGCFILGMEIICDKLKKNFRNQKKC
ncbi:putative glutamate receptor like protein [Argiope bruennichi]|uniref:Putative glutamate receptor like protein n=1 Tax=Argiope bruennichi TaxID=94029 RepID=A0A8T0G397_ARGBR|nr:putative glutamate receptor like protein [Argiope bruennichi]